MEITDSASFDCRISKGQIELLRFDKSIDDIAYKSLEIPVTAYAWSTLATSAYNPSSGVPLMYRGQGINAATFESGLGNNRLGNDGKWYPFGDLVHCLGLNQADVYNIQPIWADWAHSQQTFKCLWQTAPYANLFHRGSGSYIYSGDESFISNNAIQSVSMSYARASGPGNCPTRKYPTVFPTENARGSEASRMDEWAFRYPYPIFSNPAANSGKAYEVNWQCYNALSVGNVRHTDLNHYEIPADVSQDMCDWQLSCTQARNPPAIYGGPDLRAPLTDPNQGVVYAGWSGDREMPYLVAPGYSPSSTGQDLFDQSPACVDGALCGTSFSAPTLNGIVACVLSADSRMRNRPHAVWATLLATAENVDGDYWSTHVDGNDGAGVVSGSSAVNLAQNHSEPGPNAAAVAYAVSTAGIDQYQANGSTAKYNILIPNPKPAGKHLRVVLAWTSIPTRTPVVDNYLSDLDLSVSSNGGWKYSMSNNANIEMVDIPASDVSAGGTYQAIASLWANRFPPSGAISSALKYAIAWTWVKDHAQ